MVHCCEGLDHLGLTLQWVTDVILVSYIPHVISRIEQLEKFMEIITCRLHVNSKLRCASNVEVAHGNPCRLRLCTVPIFRLLSPTGRVIAQ